MEAELETNKAYILNHGASSNIGTLQKQYLKSNFDQISKLILSQVESINKVRISLPQYNQKATPISRSKNK